MMPLPGTVNCIRVDCAGVEVDVGSALNGARPTLAFSNAEDAWTSNLDFNPTADLTYDLGIPSKRWNEINAGSGSFAGPLSAATVSASAGIEGGSFATDGTLTVQGAADLNGGLDVVGSISASADVTAASFAADGEAHVGTLLVDGYAEVSGGLGVEGAVSASAGVTAASFAADGLADFGSLQVAGTADLNGGLDVIGAVSASQGVTAASFTADGLGDFGSLDVTGAANIGGGLDVVGAISASAALQGASVAVDGLGEFGSLDVSGNATLASLTASVGAEIQGPLSASSLVVAGNADFNGTATFNGTFAVPGTGNFGSLVVGGVSLSPISASLSTTNEQKVSGLEFSLADGQMIKLEVEAIAKGSAAAASFKYSIAARRIGAAIDVAAVEIVKEILGTQATGALMDVEITENGSKVAIEAKSTGILSEVKWNFQVVKMMKMGSDGLPVEPVAAG